MTLLHKKTDFSVIALSVAGGVSHNIGQLLIAVLVTESDVLFYYAPALMVSGVLTGILIGLLTSEVQKRIRL